MNRKYLTFRELANLECARCGHVHYNHSQGFGCVVELMDKSRCPCKEFKSKEEAQHDPRENAGAWWGKGHAKE